MTDFKKQLKQWQDNQVVEPVKAPVPKTQSKVSKEPINKDVEPQKISVDGDSLSKEERLLFLETVVQMGGAQEKTQLENALDEQAAANAVEEWQVTESELFQQQALDFEPSDVKVHKILEEQKKPSRPLVVKRILKGLEEPSVTCDLHGLDREQASQKMHMALSQCHQFGKQVLLIIHGKGMGLLRDQVIADLNANIWVAEHFVAPAHLGGEGARVIILKKKERRT